MNGKPRTLGLLALAVVAAVVAAAVVVAQPTQGWAGILTAAVYGISLALGGAILMAINVATGASWWLPLRRVPLLLARTLAVPAAALGLVLVFGLTAVYPWARAGPMSALVRQKEAWLNAPLFLARAVLVLLVWFSFVGAFRQRLAVAEASGTLVREKSLVRAAVAFLILLGVTLSVASWDWTMSLEPEWSSTMYGVYGFAGTFLGGIAAVAVLSLLLDRAGLIRLGPAQLHDLGKLLFAFATFWAYIWFCQFLLIWYTNIPEEVTHYEARLAGGWSLYFWLNPILNFAVPFATLLSIPTKRHAATLRQVAMVVLLGRWLDTYLLIGPSLGPAPAVPLAAVGATVAVVVAMVFAGQRLVRQGALGTAHPYCDRRPGSACRRRRPRSRS